MAKIITTKRFDDVGTQDSNGLYDFAYHGFNYEILIRNLAFKVRQYDEEKDVLVVISPADARTRVEAPELVSFLLSSFAVRTVMFYCGSSGSYKAVELRTLEFIG
jgi:hypothetical protein